ncbi:uncharacterized protein LOC121576978 isoform X2 [Coregonus clupeaformis]|uniref:uncharacterized protein LOC121576978 isoform X2 n=1 Tax=Coregonus clupeaformis TaxID=59861 RepID=UPI001BE06F4C|nr:uncharacterized protein LOC121576978 isoform X2 [Coregonus clupeaformis]
MYLRGKDGQPHGRVIFTKEEKKAVLTEMHAGHFGVKRMIAKINLRFFKDVDSWVIRANYFIWKNDEMKARPMKPRSSFAPSWGHHQLRVTSVEANNILQLDGQPLKALTPYTSVKPMRQYVKANHRVTGPSLTSLINPADVKKLQTGPL